MGGEGLVPGQEDVVLLARLQNVPARYSCCGSWLWSRHWAWRQPQRGTSRCDSRRPLRTGEVMPLRRLTCRYASRCTVACLPAIRAVTGEEERRSRRRRSCHLPVLDLAL